MKLSFPKATIASSIPVALIVLRLDLATAFAPRYSHHTTTAHQHQHQHQSFRWRYDAPGTTPTSPSSWTARCMSEQPPDEDGADLASQFFKAVQDRDISFEGDEIDLADADADADADAEEETEDGVDNAREELDDEDDAILREYDVSEEGSLTDEQIYDEVKDRVFESAGAFVELTKGAEDGSEGMVSAASKVYRPPTIVPDSGLTAGEVVELVLSALRNNDVPKLDYGVEVLFGYSSPDSQIVEQMETEGLTPSQYRTFLRMSVDNMAFFEHAEAVIDKADFSPDRLKGYFTARLMDEGGLSKNYASVNFILSTSGTNEDDCWLIDSMLIRPSTLRRRRRR